MVIGVSDIVKNDSVNRYREFAIVLKKHIFDDPFITHTHESCTISSHQKLIFTVMQMQVMHVAVDMNYHI